MFNISVLPFRCRNNAFDNGFISDKINRFAVSYLHRNSTAVHLNSVKDISAHIVKNTERKCRYEAFSAALCKLFRRIGESFIQFMRLFAENIGAFTVRSRDIGVYIVLRNKGQEFTKLFRICR